MFAAESKEALMAEIKELEALTAKRDSLLKQASSGLKTPSPPLSVRSPSEAPAPPSRVRSASEAPSSKAPSKTASEAPSDVGEDDEEPAFLHTKYFVFP